MRIAFDISPIKTGHFQQHQVRGSGFYVQHLQRAFETYDHGHTFSYFTPGEDLPKDIDIIHYPYFEPFFLTLPFNHATKSVVTVHDLTPLVFPDAFPSGIKGKVKWQIQKNALKKVDRIITDSHASKKDIMKFVGIPENKIAVVYLAASEEFQVISLSEDTKKAIRKKFNLPEKYILYVGDVTWNKNLPRLIKAVEKVRTPLVLVGKALQQENVDSTNPWNNDLVTVQKMIKKSDLFHPLGFVPTEDLVALYAMSDALVFPSLYEGFGLPILEAMASGCPVITSKEGSLIEVAGDSAYFCDPYSEQSIENAILSVCQSKELQEELRQKGLNHVKKFSWKKAALDTLRVYEGVMKNERKS